MNDTPHQSGMIDIVDKGLGPLETPLRPDDTAGLRWQLLREDLSLPAAVLYETRLAHNLDWMQRFVAEYSLKLAPHGKTTMAPKLFARQLAGGAWGITLATAPQTRAAYRHGVRRVLMANQLVGKQNMTLIAELLEDPAFEFFCLVDSAAGVDHLGRFFRARGQTIQVLLELGVTGGRTGVRDDAGLRAVLEALAQWHDCVALAGVELYEGVLTDESEIRALLQRAVAITGELAQAGRFARQPAILSGAGSAWYDVVAEEFSRADTGVPLDIVLRPGCYLTHDAGIYQAAQTQIQARNPIAHKMHAGLLPALQLWAYVQSIPEPGQAIVALGKRDTASDAGMPRPASHFRPGIQAQPSPAPAHWEVTRMMDQHAFLHIAPGDDLQVGDMLAFDISHPCLTFDKWRQIPVLDDAYQVIDVVQTFF